MLRNLLKTAELLSVLEGKSQANDAIDLEIEIDPSPVNQSIDEDVSKEVEE